MGGRPFQCRTELRQSLCFASNVRPAAADSFVSPTLSTDSLASPLRWLSPVLDEVSGIVAAEPLLEPGLLIQQ